MFEKVNPGHPDKIADRIAGAVVDYCYTQQENPRVAVEVLIGHGLCTVLAESSVDIPHDIVRAIVWRIARVNDILYRCVPQDSHLSENQRDAVRCGDNGIFRGVPVSDEEQTLTQTARIIYQRYGTDGKYIIDGGRLILCQSNSDEWLGERFPDAVINPLGDWTGGPDVDSGATNRKLGSDMGRAVTGGGLHGKDLSKADVSVNIWAHLEAQRTGRPQEYLCAIGDETVGGIPYSDIVRTAREYITRLGGFENFAAWGLIR